MSEKETLVQKIREHRARGASVAMLRKMLDQLHFLDDPGSVVGHKGDERSGRSCRPVVRGGACEYITQRQWQDPDWWE